MIRLVPRSIHRLATRASSAKPADVTKTDEKPKFAIRSLETSENVEKRSLSRGLALNRFEKDFMIYPEYSDSDDVKNIEGFCEVLRNSLSLTEDAKKIEKDGELSAEVLETLRNNAIFSVGIGKEFGGLALNNKDLSKIFEELSVDWNIFSNSHVNLIVSNIITIYGTQEQKSKYLPLLAQGQLRAAFAVSATSLDTCQITQSAGKTLLNVENLRIVGRHNPNFFVVFGENNSCYLIEEAELGTGDKVVFRRDETLGLKGLDVGKLDLTALVDDSNILGNPSQGQEVAAELIGGGRLSFAAATIGVAKRTLRDLSAWCNRTPSRKTTRSSLADDSRSQRIVTDLALKVYALESAVYYLSGMIDEGISVVVDIENALISMLARETLQSMISVQLELNGLAAIDSNFPYEKNIRDITTVLSLFDDSNDVEQIALATISTWATSSSHKRIVSTLKRWLKNEKESDEMRNPGLTHYIAEHAHPSLQAACQELEYSMTRINTVISKLMTSQGKNIEQDYGSLEALVNVMKNNLLMVSTISRASRSYSIGLRNSDIELAWTTILCSRLSRATWFELDQLSDLFGLVKFNPSLLNVGRAIFDLNGYAIESPIEKNW
ncbi:unnamed protein product [Caenorhabditis angaria]|uniref:Uncharacterized protein n=1 Tax=Caenorhabditis angaria TaxID=860376 RepID=A0A9P1INH0_9PELO|nr:unnamed protein product [Caenorhabditis angaria]